MLAERGAVGVADLLNDFFYRGIGFGEKRAGVLYSDVLQIGFKRQTDHFFKFSAGEGGIEKSFTAYFCQRDGVHIVLIYIVPNVYDHVVLVFVLGDMLFDCLYQNFGNIAAQKIFVSRLSFFIGFPSLFKNQAQLLFVVIIVSVYHRFGYRVQMKSCKDVFQNILKWLILSKRGVDKTRVKRIFTRKNPLIRRIEYGLRYDPKYNNFPWI